MIGCVININAQTYKVSEDFFIIPQQFTYGDKQYICTLEDNVVTVYDDNMRTVRTFQLNTEKHETRWETQRRKAEVKAVVEQEYSEAVTVSDRSELTLSEVRNWASENGLTEQEGYKFIYEQENQFFRFDEFGKAYPYSYYYWNPEDGGIYWRSFNYSLAYTGDWETIEDESRSYYEEPVWLSYEDYDDNSYPDQTFPLTQTLFNDDDKFEYVFAVSEPFERVQSEYDRDGDGMTDERRILRGWGTTGYQVRSEDGTVIRNLGVDDMDSARIIKINGKLYLDTDRGELIYLGQRAAKKKGDINQDGNVDISDVVSVINIIATEE